MVSRPFWQKRIATAWQEAPIAWLCGVRRSAETNDLPVIDLRGVSVLVGTRNGQSTAMPGGINIRTPGSYKDILGSVAEELGHKIQEGGYRNVALPVPPPDSGYGRTVFGEFNRENNRQRAAYGEAVYFTEGTYECQARTFRDAVLLDQGF